MSLLIGGLAGVGISEAEVEAVLEGVLGLVDDLGEFGVAEEGGVELLEILEGLFIVHVSQPPSL